MGSKRFLFVFGFGGGLVSGTSLAALLYAVGQASTLQSWAILVLGNIATFTLGGYLTWFQWAAQRNRARGLALSQLSQGDLTVSAEQPFDAQGDFRRLVYALRRALSDVQRVTQNVHRTCREVTDQSHMLLEAARRQGSAVDRTLGSVGAMGESLQSAGRRVRQLETFAQETTAALSEMTERIGQVAHALSTLNEFAHRTSQQVHHTSERIGAIAASGDELVRFASEAENFVATVEGRINSVRQRANETGDLAREVTATADRGQQLVGDSLKGMYRIEETVRNAAQLMASLGKRSMEIGRIVDVIQEVADQTNLLALNAAIIAAQAGEQGTAFGVVAGEIRGLAERTARSTREISNMVTRVRAEVDSAVELVRESQEQASAGVLLGDRAAAALTEIRGITQRTFSAVEATVAETARLESQGHNVVEASRRVARRVDEVTGAAVEQASHGRELVRQTQEMARLAHTASEKAQGGAANARELSESVHRLTAAIDEIRAAHQVLTRGDATISEEVAQVREDARKVIRIGDGLSRSVDQLAHEANGLDSEVFRFRLPAARRGGVLRAGMHQAAMFEYTRGLDPVFTLDSQMVEAGASMYSTFLRSESGVLVPHLAERWEADPSARRYRFHLRRDVRFHDGLPLVALHAKQHFERLLHPANKAPDQWIFKEVEGAVDFLAGKAREVAGIEVLDDHTLEIRLMEPKAFFLHLFTLPTTAVARLDGAGRPVGTGPFQPLRIDRELIVLERNPSYFVRDQPCLDRLEIRLYKDRDEVMRALKAGEVDLISGLYAENLAKGELRDFQLMAGSVPTSSFLGLSMRDAPYNDVRVRQAIRAGLDIQRMVEQFHSGAQLAKTLTPPVLLEDPDALPVAAPDVALAARLLREAGVPKVRLTLYYAPGRGTEAEDAVLFAPLIDAGLVELSHVQVPASEYWTKLAEGRIPAFRGIWIADYPDPDNFLYFLLNSSAQTVYQIGYQNAELDRVTAEARVSIDPELRNKLYRRAERIAYRDAALVPLFHERHYAAAMPKVQGLRLHQTPPQVRAETVWVDQG